MQSTFGKRIFENNYFKYSTSKQNSKWYFYITICIIIIVIMFITYWCLIRPKRIKFLKKLKQFKGFKYSHLTKKEEQHEGTPPITNTNCHFVIFGSSGSGKTSFLKHYLNQTKSDYIVFGRDVNEFKNNYVEVMQLKKFEIESLANKTIILDEAGAYKNLKTKVEDFFGLVDIIILSYCK